MNATGIGAKQAFRTEPTDRSLRSPLPDHGVCGNLLHGKLRNISIFVATRLYAGLA